MYKTQGDGEDQYGVISERKMLKTTSLNLWHRSFTFNSNKSPT